MLEKAGIAFLGPRPDTMRLFSRKHDARAFAQKAEVPILAGPPAKLQCSLACQSTYVAFCRSIAA